MKVLLVNGSPNEFGCTHRALEEVAKTLNEQGIETEIFHIGATPIGGCVACGGCVKLGKCTQDDCVNEFAEKAKDADGFIFGSPVYYASVNGAMSAFMERLFYSHGKKALAFKPAGAVAVARRAGTITTLDELNKYFTINNMPVVPSCYWNVVYGINNRPEAAEMDGEGMNTMRTLGNNMAWLLKCIELGKANGVVPAPVQKVRTNFIR